MVVNIVKATRDCKAILDKSKHVKMKEAGYDTFLFFFPEYLLNWSQLDHFNFQIFSRFIACTLNSFMYYNVAVSRLVSDVFASDAP